METSELQSLITFRVLSSWAHTRLTFRIIRKQLKVTEERVSDWLRWEWEEAQSPPSRGVVTNSGQTRPLVVKGAPFQSISKSWMNINKFMGSKVARNQEQLCWRGPAEIYLAGLLIVQRNIVASLRQSVWNKGVWKSWSIAPPILNLVNVWSRVASCIGVCEGHGASLEITSRPARSLHWLSCT